MKQIIKTSSGEYSFKPIHLYSGRKKLVKKIALENIIIFRNILSRSKIRWGLAYGTLLGAVREKDFISYDEDVDIYVFYEDLDKLINLLHKFKQCGFDVARYEKKALLSIIRKNEHIDIYIFKKGFFGKKCLNYFIPNKYFENKGRIKFYDQFYPTLYKRHDYLAFQYGEDWRVPKKKLSSLWKYILENLFEKKIPKTYRDL